jgi:hypothetical protein
MDSDSEGEYGGFTATVAAINPDLVERYRKFITALSDCPMILGFHSLRTHKNADKCCYCPCGSSLKPWRGTHGISLSVCGSSRFSANGLMDHLRQLSFPSGSLQAPCLHHWMTLTYLETLYADFWSPGTGHKALYKMGDTKYRAAEEAEARMELK